MTRTHTEVVLWAMHGGIVIIGNGDLEELALLISVCTNVRTFHK